MAHTYFPFYMGINETRYGYMDEGWATTFEYLIGRSEVGNKKAEQLYKGFRIEGWIRDASTAEDLPIITQGTELRGGLGNDGSGKMYPSESMMNPDPLTCCRPTTSPAFPWLCSWPSPPIGA